MKIFMEKKTPKIKKFEVVQLFFIIIQNTILYLISTILFFSP